MKINKFIVFLVILFFSFLISLSFFWGKIDPDFFSFYYIGKGITEGQYMYRDFADNKGPVLYLFFSLLYLIFKNNYLLSLVISSTLIDAFIVYLIFILVFRWLNKEKGSYKSRHLIFACFMTFIVKSFSIGSLTGGIYSETIAFLLVLTSLFLFEKNLFLLSGSTFSLAVLSRPTAVFWLFFIFVKFLAHKEKFHKITQFLIGAGISVVFVIFSFLRDDLYYFFNNLLIFNLGYAQLARENFLEWILLMSTLEFRILVSLIITFIFLIWYLFRSQEKKESKIIITALTVSSFLATFTGGLFHFHHFVQFSLLLFTVLLYVLEHKNSRFLRPAFILLSVAVSLNFFNFILLRQDPSELRILSTIIDKHRNLLDGKKYLMVITYYPELYIYLNKTSPDRYFIPYFLSKEFNKKIEEDVKQHSNLGKDIFNDTLFVMISKNEFDELISTQYLERFSKQFKLTKTLSLLDRESTVDVYITQK